VFNRLAELEGFMECGIGELRAKVPTSLNIW